VAHLLLSVSDEVLRRVGVIIGGMVGEVAP
jgi:hypothetical protein